ncbi:MAG: protein translocase subunit SecF [Candidatus Gastranaerophilales bacterium]|nr:protein translocase subunit SecF [Candidatus Gastranaerophilales bacterium]
MAKKTNDKYIGKQILDVIKYKWVYTALSLCLIIPSLFFMVYLMVTTPYHAPMKLGIDFTGGTMLQYGFKQELKNEDIAQIREFLNNIGIEHAVIQLQQNNDASADKGIVQEKSAVQKSSEEQINASEKAEKDVKSVVSIRTRFLNSETEESDTSKLNSALRENFGEFVPIQISAIGPTLGSELFTNSLIALLLAFFGIVGYLTVRFNMDYAMFALVSLAHNVIIVCGAFALFGILYNTEIDSLFITAVLTVIGFSVHDTIVVFDRIRENLKFHVKDKSFNEIVNISVNQTLARSINTSLTTLITLVALYFFGGATTKDFVLVMILGILIGTYSSIFIASPLLAVWREKMGVSSARAA